MEIKLTYYLLGFLFGFLTGYGICGLRKEKKKKTVKYLHCFECEIETPVKEKNGRLFCSNCGLIHLNDY